MKGFTHFVSGLAVASFFPWTVQAGQDGNPLYFLLAGAAALLPDTLDFKLLRYLYRHDMEITPDPLGPDMQQAVDALAGAIDAAASRTWKVRLNTIRMGTDCWQQYHVQIDPKTRQVSASLGAQIDTGGNPLPQQSPKAEAATATFRANVSLGYLAAFAIEMFDGPHLELQPDAAGHVQIHFIPWHRRYTHSFCIGTILAAIAGSLFGWLAAPVVFAAHASHLLLDQLGYMGSNLLWPLANKRFPGFKMQHASSTFWNTAAVWIALALLYGNLHGQTPGAPAMPPIGFLIATILLPLGLIHFWLGSSS